MRLGTAIRRLREQRGWSQEALAAQLPHTSQSTICRIENNKTDLRWEEIEVFARVFDVPAEKLIRWSADEEPNGQGTEKHPIQDTGNAVIQAKDEMIAVLIERIRSLERLLFGDEKTPPAAKSGI